MIRREKIILMTQLAVYDKYEGEADRRCSEYFRHDYIYKKNIPTRFCAALGAVILLFFHWLKKIYLDDIDLSGLDFQKELWNAAFFIIAVMILYTFIGTVKTLMEYGKSQRRLQRYFALLNRLDRLHTVEEDDSQEELYGTDIIYTRNDY